MMGGGSFKYQARQRYKVLVPPAGGKWFSVPDTNGRVRQAGHANGQAIFERGLGTVTRIDASSAEKLTSLLVRHYGPSQFGRKPNDSRHTCFGA